MAAPLLPPRWRALREPRWLGPLLLILCCIPALAGSAGLASDLLFNSRYFGANPIKAGEHFLGNWTLRLLVATLAITPLRGLTGWVWLTRHRRKLGLAAFVYALLHWLTYVLLDVQLDWGELLTDLAKRPYIIIGMGALVLMIPLATTSTLAMRRRLGRLWARLHRLVYVIAVAGVVHFWMSVKKDISEPLFYACLFGLLFAARLFAMWQARRPRGAAVVRQSA